MGTYAMIGPHGGQMISEGSRSAAGALEMVNARFWLENNMIASGPPTICEFCLELIGNTDEILIESAKCDSLVSVEREISPHKVVDFN
jgi:hypothetical protein